MGGLALGSEGEVYAVSKPGTLFSVREPGELLWKFRAGDEIHCSPVVGPEGEIYFTSFDGYLYRVNRDGVLAWKIQLIKAFSWYSSPTVGRGGRIFVTAGSSLFAVSNRGKKLWEFTADCLLGWEVGLAPGGVLYVTDESGILHLIQSMTEGPGHSPWPLPRHDPQQTGSAE